MPPREMLRSLRPPRRRLLRRAMERVSCLPLQACPCVVCAGYLITGKRPYEEKTPEATWGDSNKWPRKWDYDGGGNNDGKQWNGAKKWY